MLRTSAVLIAALLALAVTSCGGPDRAKESQQISDQIKAMPGVQSVDERYQNGIAIGSALWVAVTARPDATADQLSDVWNLFTSRIREIGYGGHDVELTITSCGTGDRTDHCGKVVSTVNTRNGDQPTPQYPEWLKLLRGTYATTVDLTTTDQADAEIHGEPNAANFAMKVRNSEHPVTAGDITTLFGRLATDFGDLRDVGWAIAPEQSYYPSLQVQELPSPDIMRLWDELNAVAPTRAKFTLQSTHNDLTGVEPSTRATHLDSTEVDLRESDLPARDVALKQLALLKASGRPGTYRVISRGQTDTVLLGACSPQPVPSDQASALQTELRQQFETC